MTLLLVLALLPILRFAQLSDISQSYKHNVFLQTLAISPIMWDTVTPKNSSIPSTSESTKGWKSTLRGIRGFKQPTFLQEPAEEDPLFIEYRGGRFNRPGDVRDGEFTDSLFRLMDHRGHLQPVETATVNGSLQNSESSALRQASVRAVGKGEGGENVPKREWNLLPGSEPIIMTLYQFFNGLVSRPIKRTSSTSNGHHHDRSSSSGY